MNRAVTLSRSDGKIKARRVAEGIATSAPEIAAVEIPATVLEHLEKEAVPKDAWPQGPVLGRLSYTVCAKNFASVEVKFANHAFVVKKLKGNESPSGPRQKQYSWSKYTSAAEAWAACVEHCGWDARQ